MSLPDVLSSAFSERPPSTPFDSSAAADAAAAFDAAFGPAAPTPSSLLASSARVRAAVADLFDAMRPSAADDGGAAERQRAADALRAGAAALAEQLRALRAQEALAALVDAHRVPSGISNADSDGGALGRVSGAHSDGGGSSSGDGSFGVGGDSTGAGGGSVGGPLGGSGGRTETGVSGAAAISGLDAARASLRRLELATAAVDLMREGAP